MERLSEEDFQLIGEAIRKSAPSPVSLMNPFVRTDRSCKPLLKSGSAKSVKIDGAVREFVFDAPAYIQRVDFFASDVERLRDLLILVVIGVNGSKKKIEPQVLDVTRTDGSVVRLVRYAIAGICVAVQVSFELHIKSVYATRFAAYGYTLEQLDGVASKIRQVTALVQQSDQYASEKLAEVGKSEERKAELDELVAAAEESVASLQSETTELETRLAVLKKEVDSASAAKTAVSKNLAEAQGALEAIRNNETQLRQTVDTLNREISDRQRDLKSLANDRSLISDEFKDYVKEGRKQAWVYTTFLAICIAVIAYCAWQLYVGANRILLTEADTTREVGALILQRLPFAAAISLIITAAWKLGQIFVNRIMTIHAQRLGLARLLVVAKDTVYSSMDGLDIPDELKFRERIKLKLMMLKSHLTSELGRDFDYVTESKKDSAKEADGEGGRDTSEDTEVEEEGGRE